MRSCDIRGTNEARATALSKIQNMETPANQDMTEQWVIELSAITAGRGADGFDADLQLSAYSARLREYPADVAKEALLKQSWKWFPAWAEVEEVCKKLAAPRRSMIAALLKPEDAPKPPKEDAVGAKARINDLVAKNFPNAAQEWVDGAVNECVKAGKLAGEIETKERDDAK